MWQLWWRGKSAGKIPPYRLLTLNAFKRREVNGKRDRKQEKKLNEWKKMCEALVEYATGAGFDFTPLLAMETLPSHELVQRSFDAGCTAMMDTGVELSKTHGARVTMFSVTTVLKNIRSTKKARAEAAAAQHMAAQAMAMGAIQ